MRSNDSPPAAWPRSAGFTLIEILIAVVIFGVIATIVYGSFNAVISKTNAIKDETRIDDMAVTCLARISSDLRAVYVEPYPLYEPPDFDDPPDPYRFAGRTDYVGTDRFSELYFASTEHLPVSAGGPEDEAVTAGLARIGYYVDQGPGEAAGYVLKRGDTPFPYDIEEYPATGPEADPVLCKGVTKFSLTYRDAEGNEFETWDSDAQTRRYATPRAVRVELEIRTGHGIQTYTTLVFLPTYREPLERVEE